MANQEKAEVITDYGQDNATNSIQTHQREEKPGLQEMSSEKCCVAQEQTANSLKGRSVRKTALILQSTPFEADYSTSYSESYAGKDWDGKRVERFNKVTPYLPRNNINMDLNLDEEVHISTLTKDSYYEKDIIPHNILHQIGVENRVHNIRGTAMKEITNPPENNMKLWISSYTAMHNIREEQPPSATISEFFPKRHNYNIITGEDATDVPSTSFKRRSGDWIHRNTTQRGCFYDRLFLQ
eukprot:gi/632952560/ref/XP_007891918.1/ PREDICTED: uncharacterized protein LOC103178797 [Callorhinchus milii]